LQFVNITTECVGVTVLSKFKLNKYNRNWEYLREGLGIIDLPAGG